MAMKNITIQSAVDEEEHGTILLEVAQFLKLYDMVNARVMLEAVKGAPAVRMYVFADRAGPFTCSEFLGEQLPINPDCGLWETQCYRNEPELTTPQRPAPFRCVRNARNGAARSIWKHPFSVESCGAPGQ